MYHARFAFATLLSYADYTMIKIVAIGLISALTMSLVSLAWPRLTAQSRPMPLQKVHDVVLGTQIGQQAAETLGVASPSGVTPIDPKQIVQSAIQTVVTTIERRTQEVVVTNAVKQLNSQFDQLPQDQKQQIQTIICKPQ